jgi:hypothetical protein
MRERFKTLFVVEPSHDLRTMRAYSDDIRLITTGDEKVDELEQKISEALVDFNPLTDAVIPMGRVSACLIAGRRLGELFPDKEIMVGTYHGGEYMFTPIGVNE